MGAIRSRFRCLVLIVCMLNYIICVLRTYDRRRRNVTKTLATQNQIYYLKSYIHRFVRAQYAQAVFATSLCFVGAMVNGNLQYCRIGSGKWKQSVDVNRALDQPKSDTHDHQILHALFPEGVGGQPIEHHRRSTANENSTAFFLILYTKSHQLTFESWPSTTSWNLRISCVSERPSGNAVIVLSPMERTPCGR